MRSLKSFVAAITCLSLAAGPAGAQAAAVRIGVAAAVSGSVMAFPPTGQPVGRIVQSGKPLYLNEKVTTDAKGRLQIILPDETVFTIGPNSEMKLDEFVYDPNTGAGKVSASILKGIFRFVTGQVAKNRPSDMKVHLPTGTLGIRGTIVAGSVGAHAAQCILLGPGPANNGGERVGSFSLGNSAGSVDVNRPGFGSILAEGQAPTAPTLVSAADLGAILGALKTESGESKSKEGGGKTSGGGSDSASKLAGQDTAGAGGDLANTQAAGDTGGGSDESAVSADQALSDPAIILNGASDWQDVRAIPSGSGVFVGDGSFGLTKCSGVSCQSPSGRMDFVLNVDFADKTLGGYGANGVPSYVAVSASDPGTSTSIKDSINIAGLSFNGATGPAVLFDKSDSGNLSVLFSLQNAAGLAAAFTTALAVYNDGSTSGNGLVEAYFNGDRGDISANIIDALPASTWGDVRNIPNGTGRYTGGGDFKLTQCGGGSCGSPSGSFDFTLNIDFKNNTFGGDCNGACVASAASVSAQDSKTNTSISASLKVPAQSFTALNGNAVITQVSVSGNFTMQYTLRNAGDLAAGIADAFASYNDGSTIGSGDGFAGLQDTSREVLNGVASTWDQMRSVPLGEGHYSGSAPFNLTLCNGGSCANPFGSMGFYLNVDFPAQTIGGDCNGGCVASQMFLAASDPNTKTSISDSMRIPGQSFASLSGNAVLHRVSDSGHTTLDLALKNAAGIAGGLADALATYVDGSTQGSGEARGFLTNLGSNPNTVLDANWDDLRSIPSGRGRYSGFAPFTLTRCGGGSCRAPTGFMTFALNVDFSNQTIGGDCNGRCVASQLLVSAQDSGTNTSISDSLTLPQQYYSSLSGNAVVTGRSSSGHLGADFAVKNAGGVAAGLADVTAAYHDGGNAGSGSATGDMTDTTKEVLNGLVSTWGDLRNIPSGTGKFAGAAPFNLTRCLGGSCLGPRGTFTYLLNVDFGNKLVGGDCGGGCAPSGAAVSAFDAPRGTALLASDSLTIPSQDFSGLSGNAMVHGQSGSGNFSVDFTLRNANGVAGALADVVANFNNGSNIGSGSDRASFSDTTGQTLFFAGPSTWDGVRTIPSGVGLFTGSGISMNVSRCHGGPCGVPYGSFNYSLSVDFAKQTIGGDCGGGCVKSQESVSGGDAQNSFTFSDALAIPAQSYAGSSGNAAVHGASSSGKFTIDFTLKNAPGVAAALADVVADYNDGSTIASGSDTGSKRATQDFVFAGPALWDDIRKIPSGTGQWNGSSGFTMAVCNGGACAGGGFGSLGFTMNVDFANKTIGGNCGGICNASAINVFASNANILGGSISDSIGVSQRSFSNLTGAAALLGLTSNSGKLSADFRINNVPGHIGQTGTVSATFNDGLNVGAGTATGTRIDCGKSNCGGGL